MSEKRRPETGSPEVLDLENYGGLYARFLLASQSPQEQMVQIINPAIKGTIDKADVDISLPRDYSPMTKKLSDKERIRAWRGKDFEQAYSEWQTQLVTSINTATDEERVDAINVISGKQASNFNKEDADKVYELYCRGKSDTTSFVKAVIGNISIDGKVDMKRLQAIKPHLEWFSAQLFGKETSVAVSRMIELESEATNKPTEVVEELFADLNRMNNLTPSEIQILTNLSEGPFIGEIIIEAPQAHPEPNPQPPVVTKPKPPVANPDTASQPTPNPEPETNTTKEPTESAAEDIKESPEPNDLKISDLTIGQEFNVARGVIKILDFPKQSWGMLVRIARPDGHPENISIETLNKLIREGSKTSQAATQPQTTDHSEDVNSQPDIPLAEGYQVQYQKDPYTIVRIEGDDIHLQSPNGIIRIVPREYLKNHLKTRYSGWKLFDKDGNPIQISASVELQPPPLKEEKEDKIPTETPAAAVVPSTPVNTNETTSDQKSGKKAIALNVDEKDMERVLKMNLSNQTEDDVTFSIPFDNIKPYIGSILGNKLNHDGNTIFDEDKNEITIRGLSIDTTMGEIKLEILFRNTSRGIDAEIRVFQGNSLARTEIEEHLKQIDSSIEKRLSGFVSEDEQGWRSDSVEISGRRILANFHNTKSTAGILPTEAP